MRVAFLILTANNMFFANFVIDKRTKLIQNTMKLIKTILVMTALVLSYNSASAWDWSSIKNAVSSVIGSDASSVVDNILQTDNLDVEDLEGTWKSTGPAVSFKSENVLEKAGGVAAAATIENKLKPYYSKVGLENATFTFTKDGAVTITLKSGRQISGTVTKGTEEGTMIFTFGTLAKLGTLTAYVSKGTSLNIMFDASKLVKLVTAIATYSGSSSLSSVSTLLNKYEGVYAGFKFDKQ